MKINVVWNVTPCSMVDNTFYQVARRHISENIDVQSCRVVETVTEVPN